MPVPGVEQEQSPPAPKASTELRSRVKHALLWALLMLVSPQSSSTGEVLTLSQPAASITSVLGQEC